MLETSIRVAILQIVLSYLQIVWSSQSDRCIAFKLGDMVIALQTNIQEMFWTVELYLSVNTIQEWIYVFVENTQALIWDMVK